MIVSHQHRFIFIRLPKTASTSVAIALSRFCGPDDIITPVSRQDEVLRQRPGYRGPQNHLRPWYTYPLRDWIGMARHRRRNPHKHGGVREAQWLAGEHAWASYFKFCVERNPFDRAISRYYFDARARPLPELNEYVCSLGRWPLSNWHRYTVKDAIAVDFVGRYERLTEDLSVIVARLGLPPIVIPTTKAQYRTDRRHYSQILNAASRRHIEAICAREIEAFSYQWVDA